VSVCVCVFVCVSTCPEHGVYVCVCTCVCARKIDMLVHVLISHVHALGYS